MALMRSIVPVSAGRCSIFVRPAIALSLCSSILCIYTLEIEIGLHHAEKNANNVLKQEI